jgi:hypothetical protein
MFEIMLLGVRGKLPFRDNSLSGWLEAGEISEPKLHTIIERASPAPYLDLFGTEFPAGWSCVEPQ